MAEALVGSAVLSAFLQVAIDRLASPDILCFFRKRKRNEELLKKLKNMLLFINALVDDAEQQQIANPHVRAWLDELKDALYDAEDVLDEIDYEITKRKVEAQLPTPAASKVRNFFTASVTSFEKKIESRVKKVLQNLEYLATQKDILKLKEVRGGAGFRSIMPERLPTTSLVDEAGIYGRDDEKEIIFEWLLSDIDSSSQPAIISIVGMGGMGKTALAQLVYNDQRVKDEFDLKAWVCVSDDFDVMTVTRTIVEAITLSTMSNDSTNDLNTLQIKLKQLLAQKRFLLVLDDVWNENYMLWEALKLPFNHGALGSKILVTTRSDIVASTMRSTKIHELKQLSEKDSWSLFKRYAFRNEDAAHMNSDLEDIGKKIIEKCKGLPLALKTIGSLLYTKLSINEWSGILESEIWEEKNNVLPALRLSYQYLPCLLKRCFIYCSLFPKDYEFDKEHLIRLWMAENFLPYAQHNRDIREVGEQCFHDLLSRSLFQKSVGHETRFVMHDLINDLAKDESKNICYRLDIDKVNGLTKMTRHVSFFRRSRETPMRFEVIYQANGLHTFMPLSMHSQRHLRKRFFVRTMPPKVLHDLLSYFKCLRVLSLSGYFNIVELPDSIGNLKHLRYLNLSGTGVKRLPNSMCFLYNLQTLKMRHCKYLEKLPSDLHKLTNLRHLDFRKTKVKEMPKQLDKLKNLQVLSSFHVGKCSDTNIKQLQKLNLRGTVSILELQNVVNPMDALAANLKNKIYLEKLRFGWAASNDKSPNDKNVLEKLQPHQNIKKLSVSNYNGIGFPDWLSYLSLSNLISLKLRNCKYCLSLPSLSLLPSLKSLSVIGFDSIVAIGPEFCENSYCTTPSLEILRFEDMKVWEEWTCENLSSAFPRLQELYIKYCPKLKEHLPAELPSIKKLVIEYCGQLMGSIPWAPSLHDLVLERCGNVQLEFLPSILKVLHIRGPFKEIFLVKKIENTIANTCLEELEISDCTNLELPLHHCHNFLLKLKIERSCDSLTSFPLDFFPKLQSLRLIECSNLETISILERSHDSLTELKIQGCSTFVSFPIGRFSTPKLESFEIIQLESLKLFPGPMNILFPSLRHLAIQLCPELESFPEGGLPSNLRSLRIRKCPKLIASRMEWDLHNHNSLHELLIEDIDVESFPDVGLLPPSLTYLYIWSCPNLRMLAHNGLCHLSALKDLSLTNCPKLQHLPKEGLPSSLSSLQIRSCPMLKEHCQKQKGKNWAKIAHIPCIEIDYVIVT